MTINHKKDNSSHAMHAVSSSRRGLWWSLILTGGFFIIELVVGLRINSVAVTADAAHNFSAAAGIGIALFAAIFASKPATARRTFGFLKLEVLAALTNGILLVGMAVLIFRMGINKLLYPEMVATLPMLILAVVGLIIGGIPAVALFKKQKTDINVRGAFWHVMETVFGSAAVLAAAILSRYAGWSQADAILGMLLAPVLLVAAWGIIRESTRTLIDLTPKNLNLLEVKQSIEQINGVASIHHMHAWSITPGRNVLSAHVKIEEDAKHDDILKEITDLLKQKYQIYFSTIQLEKVCFSDNRELKEIDFI